jgi:exosortase/archaeosortase family protein
MKKTFNYLKNLIQRYKPVSLYLIYILGLFLFVFLFKKYFYNHLSGFFIIKSYYSLIVHLSLNIYSFLGFDIEQLKQGSLLLSGIPGKFSIKLLALRQTLIFLSIALIIPLKLWKRIRLILFVFISLQFLVVLRIVSQSIAVNYYAIRLISEINIIMLNVGIFFLFFYWFKIDFALKKFLMDKFAIEKNVLKKIFLKAFFSILILGLINLSVRSGIFNLDYVLTCGIMKGASLLLKIPGYFTFIEKYTLVGNDSLTIHMGYPCIGINLMFVFAVFIVFLNGHLIHKIWFIGTGILLIYFMNILRITFLFIYMEKTHRYDSLFVDVHDIYSYTIYFLIFLMWVIWIRKFSTMSNK